MTLTVRVDLDYVPWDLAYTAQFGHGEPAMLLRLLEFARLHGDQYHFFVSTRVMSALPAAVDAILNERHALDWLCRRPAEFPADYERSLQEQPKFDHKWRGFAISEQQVLKLEKIDQDGIEFIVGEISGETSARLFRPNDPAHAILQFHLGQLSKQDPQLVAFEQQLKDAREGRKMVTFRDLL